MSEATHSSTSARINALLEAVIRGNLSDLMETVTRSNVNYTDPRYHLSLLLWAISLGRLPTVQLLLSRGASLCTVDTYGFSALHRAVWCGDVEVVRAVLFLSPASRVVAAAASSSSSSAKGVHSGSGAATVACARDDEEAREVLREGAASVFTEWLAETGTEGEAARERRRLEARRQALQWRPGAQRLIEGLHVPTGRTPLMLAAMRGDVTIVSFLVRLCGADLYATDKDGFTAAELAVLCGHTHVLAIFLQGAPGDGSGRAFPRMQQNGEEFRETAKTVQQRKRFDEINTLLCIDLSEQSHIAAK